MTTRTLSDFRAEQNIWRKDLAEQLEMPETQLERLELTGEVPQAIADKLIEAYHLPETYFTEDVDYVRAVQAAALRKSPKRPLAYFCKVSVIWYLLLSIVSAVFEMPAMLAALMDYAVSPLFEVFKQFCLGVIVAFSGVYLGSHILRKTNFRGDIGTYEFLYPYFLMNLQNGILAVFYRLFTPEKYVSDALLSDEVFTSIAVRTVIELIVAVLVCTFLVLFLDTAALERGPQKQKRLWILCAVVLAVRGLALVLALIQDGMHWNFNILRFVLLLAVLCGVLFGAKRLPKAKTLWYTALPLAAMLLPELWTLVNSLLHLDGIA